MSCDVGEATEGLKNELWRRWSDGKLCSFSKLSVTSPTSQLILQPFRSFTYVTAHSPTIPLFHLRHSSFSNPSFPRFTYVTTHSPTLPLLHLRHSSFSNPSFASPTSAHSPTFPSLHLRHNSFSNHSVASPTSQPILQPFSRFSYVTSSSLNSPGEPPIVLSLMAIPEFVYAWLYRTK